MSDSFNPEGRGPNHADRLRLKVDHDDLLRRRVENILEYALQSGDSYLSITHLLGRLLRLEIQYWFGNPVSMVHIYEQRHQRYCPNYILEYQRGVSSCPNEINPTQLLKRILVILVDLAHQGKIRLLDTKLEGAKVSESTNFIIRFLTPHVTLSDDTQEFEAFDLDALLLADEEVPIGKAAGHPSLDDTQPSRPLR